MSSNGDRLARYVRQRRDELELSQLDVWQAGGPSNTTLTVIENGQMKGLTRTTARKLDLGLQWEEGSARAVWNGGEPTPRGKTQTGSIEDEVRSSGLSADTQAYILRVIEADRARAEAERKGTA